MAREVPARGQLTRPGRRALRATALALAGLLGPAAPWAQGAPAAFADAPGAPAPREPVPAAPTVDALTQTLDALAAAQRPAGGWAFAHTAAGRPEPFTFVMQGAELVAGTLGLARWDLVVLRSPGTPSAGLALLGGWRLLGHDRWLAAARQAGDLLLDVQLPAGGWFSEMPVVDAHLEPWFPWVSPRENLDDDVTTGATRLLLALWLATGDARYRDGAERGLALLLGAQLDSGAWPHVWRPGWLRAVRRSREDRPSLNDGTTPLAVETLAEAWASLGRPDLLAAARRGAEWLVAVQGAAPQPGWAQQYDADGRPAPMRAFEPAALATWESRHAADALDAMARATGERRWCEPLLAAGRWLAGAALRPGCWPRLRAFGTGAALFADAEGRLVDRAQARPGYDWTGDFGIAALLWRLELAAGPPPPAPAPGDPGACPGEPEPFRELGGARGLAAQAALLLSQVAPPARSPCAAGD